MYVNRTLAVRYPYVNRTLAVRYPYNTGNTQGLDGEDTRAEHGTNMDNTLLVYIPHTSLGSPSSYHIFDPQKTIVISSSDIEND